MTVRAPIDEHIRRRHLELGRDVLAQSRVYLDTRFWVLLRDVILGRQQSPDLIALLDLLTEQVVRGSVLCPIEASVFIELYRQSDPETRLATAKLIDKLGRGVCISYIEDRCRAEILHFVYRQQSSAANLHHPRELIWTKIGNVFGEIVPSLPLVDADEEAVLQVGFYDHLWEHSVENVVTTIGPTTAFPHANDGGWAEGLNVGKHAHGDELRSLQHAYRIELRGALDAREDLLAGAFRYLFAAETGKTQHCDEATEMRLVNELKALIIEGARRGRLGQGLPSFQIPALLHAAMRWDRTRGYRPTDRMDIYHASAALPYCDIFMTDGPLAALIRSNGVALDRQYDTTVVADFAEAVAAVHELIA